MSVSELIPALGSPRIVRAFAMPNSETFDIPPIRERVERLLAESSVSIDPFARNRRWATWSNDINPDTAAEYHMEARDFLRMLVGFGVVADLVLLDPPYSPTQIKRAYQSAGLKCGQTETQGARLIKECRELCNQLVRPGARALVCGWNSLGMCKPWVSEEILLVNHGGQHNDTIATTCRLPDQANTQAEPR